MNTNIFKPFYSELILDLQKNCKEYKELPYIVPSASPEVSILHNQSQFVKTKT